MNDLPFPFSIIAKTEVVALKISKSDLQSKIPSEFRHQLEEKSRDRNKWLQNRVKAISNTSQIIYRQDHKQTVYDTVMNQLHSQHPQATSNAVKSFTRHHINRTGMENSGRIIKRVSTNHRKSEHQAEGHKDDLEVNMSIVKNKEMFSSFHKPSLKMNKAAFSLQPPKNFEYQNLVADYEKDKNMNMSKAKSLYYNQMLNKRQSQDMANNTTMKLRQHSKLNSLSLRSHQRSFIGK